MLSRLMKYEMRSQSRLLLPLHALLLLASILGRFFITGKIYERVPTVVFIILITLYLFSLVGISTGTQLFISVRFYQSLFSDEGYSGFYLAGDARTASACPYTGWRSLGADRYCHYLCFFYHSCHGSRSFRPLAGTI